MPQIFYAAAGPQVRPTPFFLPCKKPEPFRNPGSAGGMKASLGLV